MQSDADFLKSHLAVWTQCLCQLSQRQQQSGCNCLELDDFLSCKIFNVVMKAIWPPNAENAQFYQQMAACSSSSSSSSSMTAVTTSSSPDLSRIGSVSSDAALTNGHHHHGGSVSNCCSSSCATTVSSSTKTGNSPSSPFQLRFQCWSNLVRALLAFYEIVLQQLVLMQPPNISILASTANSASQRISSTISNTNRAFRVSSSKSFTPTSRSSSNNQHQLDPDVRFELEVALRLLLGCAVQAESTKELVISYVTTLDLHIQDAIRVEIESITHNRFNVFPLESIILTSEHQLVGFDLADLKDAARCLSRSVSERNELLACLQRFQLEQHGRSTSSRRNLPSNSRRSSSPVNNGGTKTPPTSTSTSSLLQTSQSSSDVTNSVEMHLAVSELRTKLRQCQSELESKTEQLEGVREDLEERLTSLQRLKAENNELQREARSMRELRDELDAVRQEAARAERLERENTKFRERIAEMELSKKRLDELREENRVLSEVRLALERKLEEGGTGKVALARAEAEADRARKEVLVLRSRLEEAERVVDNLGSRCGQLQVELLSARDNASNSTQKSSASSASSNNGSDRSSSAATVQLSSSSNTTLDQQLEESVTAKLLRLELENERLQSLGQEASSKCAKLAELESEFEQCLFEKNEALQDRERLRHFLDRIRDACDSRLRTAFSLVSVIKNSSDHHQRASVADLLERCLTECRHSAICESLQTSTPNFDQLESSFSSSSFDEQVCSKLNEMLAFSDRLAKLDAEVVRLTETNSSLCTERVTLTEQLSVALKNATDAVEGAESTMSELKNRTHELQNVVNERDLITQRLQRSFETIDTLQQRQDTLAQEKELLQSQLTESEEAVDQMKQMLARSQDVEDELVKLRHLIGGVDQSLLHWFNISGGVSELSSRLQSGNESDVASLVEQMARAIGWADPRSLEAELTTVRLEEGRRLGELAAELVSMKNRLVDLERANATLDAEAASLRLQIKEASSRCREAQTARSELAAEKARLEGEVAEMSRQVIQLKDSLVQFQTETSKQASSAQASAAEVKMLSEQLRRAEHDAEQLRESLDVVENSAADSTAVLNQLQFENDELIRQRADLQNEHARLEEQFKQLFNELRKYQQVNPDALLFKIEHMRQMNDRLEMAVNDMSEQMRALLKHNEELLTSRLHDSEKHNSEQKYYMDMLSTIQHQKATLESKMFQLWNEREEKRRRSSASGLEHLVQKAKHLFQQHSAKHQGAPSSTASSSPASDLPTAGITNTPPPAHLQPANVSSSKKSKKSKSPKPSYDSTPQSFSPAIALTASTPNKQQLLQSPVSPPSIYSTPVMIPPPLMAMPQLVNWNSSSQASMMSRSFSVDYLRQPPTNQQLVGQPPATVSSSRASPIATAVPSTPKRWVAVDRPWSMLSSGGGGGSGSKQGSRIAMPALAEPISVIDDEPVTALASTGSSSGSSEESSTRAFNGSMNGVEEQHKSKKTAVAAASAVAPRSDSSASSSGMSSSNNLNAIGGGRGGGGGGGSGSLSSAGSASSTASTSSQHGPAAIEAIASSAPIPAGGSGDDGNVWYEFGCV